MTIELQNKKILPIMKTVRGLSGHMKYSICNIMLKMTKLNSSYYCHVLSIIEIQVI